MSLSSSEINKKIIESLIDFSLNLDSYKSRYLPSETQLNEIISLGILVNNLINLLEFDFQKIEKFQKNYGLIIPSTDFVNYKKIKRVLDLVFKYKSDLTSISIDIGENIASTNRYLQTGIDYIFKNISNKYLSRMNIYSEQSIENLHKEKPISKESKEKKADKKITKPQAQNINSKPVPKRQAGCLAPLIFFSIVIIGSYFLYKMIFGNQHATQVTTLVKNYRSDQELKPLAKKSNTREIKISGSGTLVKLIQDTQNKFLLKYPELSITYDVKDSAEAISALITGDIDIASVSRIPSVEERKKAQRLNTVLVDHKIALDAVAVFVNYANPLNVLSIDDLKRIYQSESINWLDFAGNFSEVKAFSKSELSGTYAFFKERVLFSEPMAESVIKIYKTDQIVKMIEESPNGIGYASTSNIIGRNVKVLKISTAFDENGSSPLSYSGSINEISVSRGEYPLTRYLYLITTGEISENEAKLIDFLRSDEIQSMLSSYGIVPINK